jgi:SAM-dependent methyltransferase
MRRGVRHGRRSRGAARPDSTMTTTPTSDDQARDVPAWTGDAVDYDVWFDTLWGHHAFAVESATVRRACGALAGRRALDAGCGTGRFSAALAGRGHITKQGSTLVRWAAIEAVARYHGGAPIAPAFMRIQKRRGTMIARVAAARKLLTLVFYGLRDGEIRCRAREAS